MENDIQKIKRSHFFKIRVLFSKLPKIAQKKYVLLLLFSMLIAALELVVITSIASIINNNIDEEIKNFFNITDGINSGAIFASIILLCVGRILLAFFTAHVNATIGHQLSLSIYKNVFSWDYINFERESKNEIVADLMVKINQTVGRIIRPLTQMSISLVIILVLIPIMIIRNPIEVLSLCALAVFIYFSFSKLIHSQRDQISFVIAKNTNKLSQHIRESLDGFILIKKQGLFSDFNKKYSVIDKDLRSASDLSLALGVVPKYLLEFSAIALILLYSLANSSGIIDYSFLLVALFRVAPLFQQIFLSLHSFKTFNQVLDDVLDRLERASDAENKVKQNFENLFSGPSDYRQRTVMVNLSPSALIRHENKIINFPEIQILLGGLNLLKGESGSGKTSFFNCILSLYEFSDPPIITLVIDGDHVELIDETWAEHSFYISQETILFEASLMENLLVTSGDCVENDLRLILDVTGLSEFMDLDTLVAENGKNLSGGQKQRICLGRALASKKPLIFIDEGINALDSAAQKQVIGNIRKEFPWVTIFMICHDHLFDSDADIINQM